MPETPRLSIIIPTLEEAATIETLLTRLRERRVEGMETVVVDGGSLDDTAARARPLASMALVRCMPGLARRTVISCCSWMPIRDARPTVG